jgi:hypothetical protein
MMSRQRQEKLIFGHDRLNEYWENFVAIKNALSKT